ncbi:MAG TPA: glycosyltransferase family 4 protein [Steroidobacteraceae bacterium]
MRLITVTTAYPAQGGLELVAARLVEEFAQRGIEVHWISSDTEVTPPDFGQQVRHFPIRTWNIIERLTQLPYPLWSPLSLPYLWRAIGAADAVHIHEHLYAGSIAALLIARLRHRPVIITQHMGALGLPNRTLTVLYESGAKTLGRILFPLAARTVFISANVRHFFRQDANPRSCLIFNGTDTELFSAAPGQSSSRQKLGIPAEAKVVLFVGRFVRKKGLRILRQLAQRHPEVFWMIIGSGPENPQDWGLSNVRVYGRVNHDNLPDHYRAADLLLLPSAGEGFPLVVQEALCCGTGVLSTDEVGSACPPASEMIRTCTTPRDGFDVNTWSQALNDALSDSDYMQSREARSRAARALWSWNSCAEAYLRLFREIIPDVPR